MIWRYRIALKTLVIREFLRFIRIWIQTVLPPVITVSLYFLIFGNLIGPKIGDMDGFSYINYIAPGILLMTVLTNSYANVVSSFYSSKFQRHVEELLISPVPNGIILLGYVCGGVFRGMIVGTVVGLVALGFTGLSVASPWLAILVVLLTSVLFSLAGFINAIYANSFDDITIIPTFVLTPLTYLGGIFYSISLLPEFWQQVSLLNPILYMVNAFRYSVLGSSDIDIMTAFSVILGVIFLLVMFSLHLLNKGTGIRS
jgi:ABC-2 type transport system permease protein